jgi:hypothetical protein
MAYFPNLVRNDMITSHKVTREPMGSSPPPATGVLGGHTTAISKIGVMAVLATEYSSFRPIRRRQLVQLSERPQKFPRRSEGWRELARSVKQLPNPNSLILTRHGERQYNPQQAHFKSPRVS